ncbi:MAG: hypothetical protein AB1480_17365 [Nitrospirota bacterium]
MQAKTLKIDEIYKELTTLPDEKLDEVKDFIEFVSSKFQVEKKAIVKLKGIWSGKGFEKISNLEAELKSAKRELAETILKKKI